MAMASARRVRACDGGDGGGRRADIDADLASSWRNVVPRRVSTHSGRRSNTAAVPALAMSSLAAVLLRHQRLVFAGSVGVGACYSFATGRSAVADALAHGAPLRRREGAGAARPRRFSRCFRERRRSVQRFRQRFGRRHLTQRAAATQAPPLATGTAPRTPRR